MEQDNNQIIRDFWASKPKISSVAKKIHLVMTDVERLGKDGTNSFQRYKYVSEANAVAKVRESWVNHGLIAIPYTLNVQNEDGGKTKQGAQQHLVNVEVLYQIIDVETGEYLLASFPGSGLDSGDKGIYKAMTGTNKYFLFKTFQLETTDDPEQPNARDKENPKGSPQSGITKDYIFRINSQFNGVCAHCQQPYGKGDNIVKTNDNTVIHGSCFDKL